MAQQTDRWLADASVHAELQINNTDRSIYEKLKNGVDILAHGLNVDF